MSKYVLIYDDACPICRSAVRKIRCADHRRQIQPVPIAEAVSLSLRTLPAKDELEKTIHLVDPTDAIFRGAEALAIVTELLPPLRVLRLPGRLPGVRHLANVIYRLVARNRMKISSLLRMDKSDS